MNSCRKFIVALAAVSFLSASGHALDLGKIGVKKGKGGAIPFNFDAPAAEQSETFIDVSGGRSLKGIKKLGIVNFTVEYTLSKTAKIITRRPGVVAEAESTSDIPEMDTKILVELTDALYARLVKDLEGAGIEMIPFETLQGEKRFQKLKGAQHENPWETSTKDGRSVFIGARGMPIYLDNPERADFLKGLGMSFGTNTRMHETLLANDVDGHLLSVNMVIDFADLQTRGSLGFADIETGYEQFLHAGNTRYRFIKLGQPELAMLTVKKAILPDINPFSDIKKGRWKINWKGNWQSDDDAAMTRESSYKFNPGIYYQNCENLANAVHGLMMAELYKARGLTPPESASVPLAKLAGAAPAQ
jgi:hypothetical protein